MLKKMTVLLFVSILIVLSSCKKDQTKTDDDIIQEYIADNGLDATKHESGLYYIINEEGDGDHPTVASDITIKYKGYLTDGTVFDETGDQAVSFDLSQLIEGWQIAIPLLKKGGNGIFLIPSALGYGGTSIGEIPANSVLIFEIELVDFI